MISPPTYRLLCRNYNSIGPSPEEVRDVLSKGRSSESQVKSQTKIDFYAAVQPLLDDIEKCARITAEDLSLRVD